MKTKLSDFTSADHYGRHIFQGGTEEAKKFEPRRTTDEWWDDKLKIWQPNSMGYWFAFDVIYSRPVLLGNEDGKPPVYRLVELDESPIKGDEFIASNNTWHFILQDWCMTIEEFIHKHNIDTRAVRRRIAAIVEPKPETPKDQPKFCGEWISPVTGSDVSDLDGYTWFSVVIKSGSCQKWTGVAVRNNYRALHAFLKPYPAPEPPPLPTKKDCCEKWTNLKSKFKVNSVYQEFKYCPFCRVAIEE